MATVPSIAQRVADELVKNSPLAISKEFLNDIRNPESPAAKRLNAMRSFAIALEYVQTIIASIQQQAVRSVEISNASDHRVVQFSPAQNTAAANVAGEKLTQREDATQSKHRQIAQQLRDAVAQVAALEQQRDELQAQKTAVEQQSAQYINKDILRGEFKLDITQAGIFRTTVITASSATKLQSHFSGAINKIMPNAPQLDKNKVQFEMTAASNTAEVVRHLENTQVTLIAFGKKLQELDPILDAGKAKVKELKKLAHQLGLAVDDSISVSLKAQCAFINRSGRVPLNTTNPEGAKQAKIDQATFAHTTPTPKQSGSRKLDALDLAKTEKHVPQHRP